MASSSPLVQVLQCNETNIQVYTEQYWDGPNKNETRAVSANMENAFGQVEIIDWPVSDGQGQSGKVVGRIQGQWTRTSYRSGDYWRINASIMFLNDKYKGSSIEVHGTYNAGSSFQWAIAGGTGVFTLAQGKVSGKNLNQYDNGRAMELSIRVFHYPI